MEIKALDHKYATDAHIRVVEDRECPNERVNTMRAEAARQRRTELSGSYDFALVSGDAVDVAKALRWAEYMLGIPLGEGDRRALGI